MTAHALLPVARDSIRLTCAVVFLTILFSIPTFCTAATLSLPQTGSHTVGQTFTVPLHVSTAAGENINAVSATLAYPADKLQVVSLAKTGIVDIWVEEPTFSNTSGTITFQGIKYNPGFTGQNGTVIAITFKALAPGSAEVSFQSASTLANDGHGTNVLTDATGATLSIKSLNAAPAAETPPQQATISPGGPSAVSITSATHPDPAKWYNKKTIELTWKSPPDVTAIRLKLDKQPLSVPTIEYDPPISQKTVSVDDDGTWYFHVQAKNASGWGALSHYKIQIDTTPPNPMHLTFPHGAAGDDPRPVVLFNTTDDLSGIDYYNVTVKGQGTFRVETEDVGSNPYVLPVQKPGMGSVTVLAYDKAGNIANTDTDFTITGIESPVLDPINDLTEGDILEVSGTTYPDARIDVFVTSERGDTTSQWVRTQPNGAFRLVWTKRLDAGVYGITAKVTTETGAQSAESEKIDFQVRELAIFKISWLAINYLSLALLFITVITTFWIGCWYLYQRIRMFEYIKHWFGHVHHTCERCIATKDFARDEIAMLEHIRLERPLSAEETQLLERLEQLAIKVDGTTHIAVKKEDGGII